jgi:putative glutamine amidotransferase
VGKGLEITAWAADGVSEGLENEDGSVLLVQGHPEEMLVSKSRMEGLFRHLIHLAEQGTEI